MEVLDDTDLAGPRDGFCAIAERECLTQCLGSRTNSHPARTRHASSWSSITTIRPGSGSSRTRPPNTRGVNSQPAQRGQLSTGLDIVLRAPDCTARHAITSKEKPGRTPSDGCKRSFDLGLLRRRFGRFRTPRSRSRRALRHRLLRRRPAFRATRGWGSRSASSGIVRPHSGSGSCCGVSSARPRRIGGSEQPRPRMLLFGEGLLARHRRAVLTAPCMPRPAGLRLRCP
jgi:hypothetical protein